MAVLASENMSGDAEQEYFFRREADVDTLTCNCQLESV
jgi:hypothetical protein